MSMREQLLKTWPEPFWDVRKGLKTFEARRDDRDYQVGDVLVLLEYDPIFEKYSGQTCRRVVTYILRGGQFGIQQGYVVMAISEAETVGPARDEAGLALLRTDPAEFFRRTRRRLPGSRDSDG